MTKVGMRELRHRLRDYLRRAEAGEAFEVTSFGRTVAQLGPSRSEHRTWERLVAEGKITPPLNPDTRDLPAPYRVLPGPTATEALLAERREDPR
jgi:prevent-host-death family protein